MTDARLLGTKPLKYETFSLLLPHDARPSFFIHHEERTTGYETTGFQFTFSSFVLFTSFVWYFGKSGHT
jgi:hypothetical protein